MSILLNDSVHGHIRLSKDILKYIDTPQFQRLRNLSQLGTAYQVYPGATHNRFEHCIGTSHLASQFLTILTQNQPEYKKISKRQKFLVQIAGLCHDLGHGPFSHIFENEFVRSLCGSDFHQTHEEMSTRIFEQMVDENQIDIEREEIRFVQSLIDPKSYMKSLDDIEDYYSFCNGNDHIQHRFLYDIISNSRNSIDVDKFDYILRDCHQIGMQSSFDYQRLMHLARIIDDRICFHVKEVSNIYELFHMRYRLFTEVYQHKTIKAISLMVCDAFKMADSVFGFSDILKKRSIEEFSTLTDGVLYQIEFSSNKALKKSQNLIRRIKCRDLYRFVGKSLISPIMNKSIASMRLLFNEKKVSEYCSGLIKPEDIVVDLVTFDYGMEGQNPVMNTKFFTSEDLNKSFNISNLQPKSQILPEKFQETYVRCYAKEEKNEEKIKVGFNKFLKSQNLRQ